MIYIIFLICTGLLFFFLELQLSEQFVFTDANLYLYYADQITKGSILYRDLYMTNFPLVPYISVFYMFVTVGSIHGFYMTASIEALVSAIILFLCLQKLFNNKLVSLIGFLFFLSTFLVFSSASHQNGILLAVLFYSAAYLCFLYKKFILTGILLGLALLTKAYMLPVVAAFIVYLLIKHRKQTLRVTIGFIGSVCIILLPTLLFAYQEFINQVFGYSLTRTAGFDKISILKSFISYDPVVVGLLLYSLFRFRKEMFPALATAFSVVFIFFYQDLYLLYFTMFVPIATLALGDLLSLLQKTTKNITLLITLMSIVLLVNILNVDRYIEGIHGLMAIPNIDEFVSIVEETKPDYLYGEYGIVQGISYLSEIPMLEGTSDTNRKMYLSGVLDKDTITEKIKSTKTTVITYSSNDNLNITTASAILNWKKLEGECEIIHSQDFKMSYPINKINILKCF